MHIPAKKKVTGTVLFLPTLLEKFVLWIFSMYLDPNPRLENFGSGSVSRKVKTRIRKPAFPVDTHTATHIFLTVCRFTK
jgi:hypothetical protein